MKKLLHSILGLPLVHYIYYKPWAYKTSKQQLTDKL